MRRIAIAIATSFFAVVLAAPTFAVASDSADECVVVYRNESDKGIDFEVQNNCQKALSCGLKWTISCENASGKTTSSSKKDTKFGVEAAKNHHENASAAACSDGWKVDDVSWDCAPTK